MSLLAEHNIPFAAALLLMALLALLQALGLSGIELDPEASADADTSGPLDGLLSVAGVRHVPFMIWLASLLLLFAGSGIGIQSIAIDLLGGPLNRWIAAAAACVVSLPATAMLSRPLSRILPRDETTAVELESLVGRRATITLGRASAGSPARAIVKDRFGHPHHVMVEPHDAAGEIRDGEMVLLVRRERETFYGVPLQDWQLTPMD
ncbi:hypothetical protein SLG_00240 [Sphingobium sp. SYK-6]|uniref:OB-fold-containig protein n=1 Tax=Sphingobium sp. (strain NBRC 103272 / SYK-6) TaxID=627192 RepID=UPI00022768FD|nr:OB-fold-containig protein [Sphingobium sp. SYK-6]BAK64699.1 hypothetical protein SLG_00240 [Sphingobium sp. SYK-6]